MEIGFEGKNILSAEKIRKISDRINDNMEVRRTLAAARPVKIDLSHNKQQYFYDMVKDIVFKKNKYVSGSIYLKKFLNNFIKDKNYTLAQRGPWFDQNDRTSRLNISTTNEDDIIHAFGLRRSEIAQAIRRTGLTSPEWAALNNPFNVFLTIMLHVSFHFRKEEKYKRYDRNIGGVQRNFHAYTLFCTMLTLKIYTIKLVSYFHHGTDIDTMEYIISHKMDKKFSIKESENMLEFIFAISESTFTNEASKKIELLGDKFILNTYNNIHNRVNSIMKKIAVVYYANIDNRGKKDSLYATDSEGKTYMRIPGSISNMIVQRVTFIQHSMERSRKTNKEILSNICKENNMSSSMTLNIRDALDIAIDENLKEVSEFYTAIFTYFLLIPDEKKKNGLKYSVEDILSTRFLKESKSMMTMTNTHNESVLKARKTINAILSTCMKNYDSITREATKVGIRSVVHTYFIFYAQLTLSKY